MRVSKLLTTLAIASVVLIAGCNCNDEERWSDGPRNDENPEGNYPGTPGQLAPGAVDLGTAGNYVILAKSGISTTGTTLITGNIGVSPIAADGLTGFGLTMDASGRFSTSALVIGKVYASDYAVPTPANLTTAVSDMETAYTDAAGRAANVTELGDGDISGMTLAPGVYKWSTGLLLTADVTLSGGANAVWIFQVAGTLTVLPDVKIILSGGAQAKNIFWQVADVVALQERSHFEGTILGMTDITLTEGASVNGRLLAQTEVTLIGNTVTFSGTSGGGGDDGDDDGDDGDGCKDKKDKHGDNWNHDGNGNNGNGDGCKDKKDNHGDNWNYNGKDKKDDHGKNNDDHGKNNDNYGRDNDHGKNNDHGRN